MKIKLTSFLGVVFSLLIISTVIAKPISSEQKKGLEGSPQLREQMSKMIISIADLDILVNRDKILDYEIFKSDAERILSGIKEIRDLDKNKIYEPWLKELESPAKSLLKYSVTKNKKAAEYPEQIFNACFKCHKANRSY